MSKAKLPSNEYVIVGQFFPFRTKSGREALEITITENPILKEMGTLKEVIAIWRKQKKETNSSLKKKRKTPHGRRGGGKQKAQRHYPLGRNN